MNSTYLGILAIMKHNEILREARKHSQTTIRPRTRSLLDRVLNRA